MKVEMIEVTELKVGDKVVADINHQFSPEWVMEVEKIEQPAGYENTDTYWVDFKWDENLVHVNQCYQSRRSYYGYVLVVR